MGFSTVFGVTRSFRNLYV